ncbi:hypothetical protein CYMTET_37562 [Cymbomonas tetramitiformis]|uniref:EGF-like domain-containing protein n=1 Tax=Cymbomonas tetramitiformis TaxID=36881 RepID=A0AAE0CFV4_9CHLO|nr:hypothetical protein CYMTET_37562 [Cymbomonas tetramitiformis]
MDDPPSIFINSSLLNTRPVHTGDIMAAGAAVTVPVSGFPPPHAPPPSPCTTAPPPCYPGVTCVDALSTTRGFLCGGCPTGLDGNGTVCDDVDECAASAGVDALLACDPLTTCTNLLGGFECGPCPAGTSGSGDTACVDIDGCATAPCFQDTLCEDVAWPGVGVVCGQCPDGYDGDGRVCEPKQCEPGPCSLDPFVPCTTLPGGGRTCGLCPVGYVGDGVVCDDIDECETNNGGCHALTSCTNTPGGRLCGDCPIGFTGSGYSKCYNSTQCAEDYGGCDPLVECVDTSQGPRCGACPAGYKGDGYLGCVDIDGCLESTCFPGVPCEDIPAEEDGIHGTGHRCGACSTGMIGDGIHCTDDMCFWLNGGCDPSVACVNDAAAPGGRMCGACPPGYTDEFTGQASEQCLDADGCLGAPCPGGRMCSDVAAVEEAAFGAAYMCGPCPQGFLQVGEGCVDVDECAVDNGGCWVAPADDRVKAPCVNSPGGYTCGSCPAGMRGSGAGKCVPATTCAVENGGCWVGDGAATGLAASCEDNAYGPAQCGECPLGFEGSGASSCVDADGCGPEPCFPGVACTDVPAPGEGFTCGSCPEGFRGDGEMCTLCRPRVSIQYTTAVQGIVKRTGWHRGERVMIGGENQGLDHPACVNIEVCSLFPPRKAPSSRFPSTSLSGVQQGKYFPGG